MATEDLLEPELAAAYLHLQPKYLLRQCRAGTGPIYWMPSARKILFKRSDLDQWRASWVERNRDQPQGK